MIEFNKIFCDLHPNELISNYCAHGTPQITQNSATLVSAPPASALTPKPTCRKELHLTTRTSGRLTRKCKITSDAASLLWNMKNLES